MNCDFCHGPKNTNKGLATEGLDLIFGKAIGKTISGKPACPLGYTHNPNTKKATRNMIKNGGKNSICARNPW